PAAGVVDERAPLPRQSAHPDRQLVRDDDALGLRPVPGQLVRRLAIAARQRRTICRYGSPQDGVSGLYRRRRFLGSASRRTPSFCPSNEFAASITRSSVNTGSSSASASGSIVCWVRSSGEATSSTGAVFAVEKCF